MTKNIINSDDMRLIKETLKLANDSEYWSGMKAGLEYVLGFTHETTDYACPGCPEQCILSVSTNASKPFICPFNIAIGCPVQWTKVI